MLFDIFMGNICTSIQLYGKEWYVNPHNVDMYMSKLCIHFIIRVLIHHSENGNQDIKYTWLWVSVFRTFPPVCTFNYLLS